MLPRIAFGQTSSSAPSVDAWKQMPRILARIKPPKFPKKDFNVVKYGAVAGGKTDCTEAFRKAIEACNKAGGGRVVMPKGEFLTGAIHLKSNVNLHVSKGATLKFSTDEDKYPIVHTRWEGMELMNYSALIYAYEQENIAVTGEGTLDGQGDIEHWWPWNGRAQYGWKQGAPNQRLARARLYKMMDENVPVEQRVFGKGHYLTAQFHPAV